MKVLLALIATIALSILFGFWTVLLVGVAGFGIMYVIYA